MEEWRRNWNSPEARAARQRQQNLDIWWDNALGIYFKLYQFPAAR